MTIVPAGKMRLMVSQNIENPLYDQPVPEGIESPVPGVEEPLVDESLTKEPLEEEVLQDDSMSLEQPVEQEMESPQSDKKKTLSDYVFKKLQSYGYPGRRLEEYKPKFVDQDIAADGTENVKIEIPDKKYPNPNTGSTDSIEAQDLKEIVKEIRDSFGLNFTGAHRSEGKWTISFTSGEVTSEEDQEPGFNDNLDEVYGAPSKGQQAKKVKPVKAYTLKEMITAHKKTIMDKLKSIIGD